MRNKSNRETRLSSHDDSFDNFDISNSFDSFDSSGIADSFDSLTAAYEAQTYPPDTIRTFNQLTNNFYAQEAASFSRTRQTPWLGWQKLVPLLREYLPQPFTCLDLGCGNLRFEQFLAAEKLSPSSCIAIDKCRSLSCDVLASHAEHANNVTFVELDLIETLLNEASDTLLKLTDNTPAPKADLSVCFGVMHHLPTFTLRAQTLQALLEATRLNGLVVLAFWQPMNEERLFNKALDTTEDGREQYHLPPFHHDDYLLGWQEATDVYRFCHHTTDTEIDALLRVAATHSSCAFREIARFSADGKATPLNRYLVLQVTGLYNVGASHE